ncbi:hypothetical protein AVEN_182971-1 [Araneus ventricosus]|uniref:Uncharacterized protein n=1 Tax=Araneus ventricosus TaxID=182803 RepID=A0A4Y2KMV6_ARAVE|nr:hypothetical protein AVEN_182971-1 [Araneus ventricosus]
MDLDDVFDVVCRGTNSSRKDICIHLPPFFLLLINCLKISKIWLGEPWIGKRTVIRQRIESDRNWIHRTTLRSYAQGRLPGLPWIEDECHCFIRRRN